MDCGNINLPCRELIHRLKVHVPMMQQTAPVQVPVPTVQTVEKVLVSPLAVQYFPQDLTSKSKVAKFLMFRSVFHNSCACAVACSELLPLRWDCIIARVRLGRPGFSGQVSNHSI
eukprot:5719977-Amphidinium_carterae.1